MKKVKKITKLCLNIKCSKIFLVHPSRAYIKCCSKKCSYIHRKGKCIHSKEQKEKWKTSRLKHGNSFFNKKHKLKTKKIISQKQIGRIPWNKGIRVLGIGEDSLIFQIRNLKENFDWRQKVLQRDSYTCQSCFSKRNLEVHHKKRFSEIFKEFLQTYYQFSPFEDKETLVRLSLTYSDFWDISNGKVLCKKCHKKEALCLKE